MTLFAVTVIGHDRPGIIAEATGALAELGGNLEDSTMSILRGHFAMVLLVSVREVPVEAKSQATGTAHLLSVHGADRAGIVSAVAGVVAGVGGNITDLSTRLTGDLYVLLAEVDLPPGVDVGALTRDLEVVARSLGVDVTLRPLDTDLL